MCNIFTKFIAGHFPLRRLPFRLVAGAWCLIAVIIFYAYTSTLISYISLPVYDSIINNWDELAASKTLRVATTKGSPIAPFILVRMHTALRYLKKTSNDYSFVYEYLKNAKTGPMKVLGDSLRRHPSDLILGLPGQLDEILNSRCCACVEVA